MYCKMHVVQDLQTLMVSVEFFKLVTLPNETQKILILLFSTI